MSGKPFTLPPSLLGVPETLVRLRDASLLCGWPLRCAEGVSGEGPRRIHKLRSVHTYVFMIVLSLLSFIHMSHSSRELLFVANDRYCHANVPLTFPSMPVNVPRACRVALRFLRSANVVANALSETYIQKCNEKRSCL